MRLRNTEHLFRTVNQNGFKMHTQER